jgi:hypothetical protein
MLIGNIAISVSVARKCGERENGASENSKKFFHNIESFRLN